MSESLDKKAYVTRKAEFMINIDAFSADWFLRNHFTYIEQKPENYVRMQMESNIEMDDVRESALNGLQADGMKMWNNQKDEALTLLHNIIDDKFKPQSN